MTQITYATAGKTRSLPLSDEYVSRLTATAQRVDPSLGIVVVSAGQEALDRTKRNQKRTGSTRHDVDHTGHAHTSDIVLTRNGKQILPGEDRTLYSKFMEEAAAEGFTGIGHYAWGIHVGGGSQKAWGPSTGSSDLDPEFGAAIERGWARAGQVKREPLPAIDGHAQAGGELAQAIIREANRIGADPVDFATVISYETAGTFDPWKKGPVTKWGQHEGLIQMGETQRNQFGYSRGKSVSDLVAASATYLEKNGFERGMKLNQMYSIINAGGPNRGHWSDEANGGAPGTVDDKVAGMADHRAKAEALLGGTYRPKDVASGSADISASNIELPEYREYSPYVPPKDGSTSSLWDLQKDAYNVNQTLPWLFDGKQSFQPDPNWSLDGARMRQDFTDRNIPIEEIDRYSNRLVSNSESDYLDNLGRITEDYQRRVRLQEAGAKGVALELANQFLDPVALAADIGASAIAPQLVLGNRAKRVSGLLYHGVAGAAGGLAGGAMAASVNPNRDQMDMLYGTVFGFGVGGVVGKMIGNPNVAAEGLALSNAARRVVEDYEGVVAGKSVGAAQASRNQPFLNDEALDALQGHEFTETFGSKFRGDLSAMLQKSKNTMTKALAGLVQDGTGKKGGAINAIAASEDQVRIFDRVRITEAQTYNAQLKKFKEANPKFEGDIEAHFNSQVDAYIRDRAALRGERFSPEVMKVGDTQAALYKEALEMMKDPFVKEGLKGVGRAVKGVEEVEFDPHYAPRFWAQERIVMARTQYGQDALERVVFGAMRSANADVEEEILERTAKAFTRAIVNRAHGLEDMSSFALSGDKLDTLLEMLKHGYGLKEADANALKVTFRPRGEDAGRDARLKQRVLMDESFRLSNVQRLDGVADEKGLGISDLISTNARENFTRYMRSASGRIALARYRFKDPVTGETLINGFASDGEFNSYLAKVRQKGADLIAEGKASSKDVDADIKRLEFAYSSILGRPTHEMEATRAGWFLRMARKMNFSRIMNQVGFAQVSEVGAPIAALGFKASLSQMPALRRIVNADGATILKSGLGNDLEAIMGVGADRLLATVDQRLDDLTGIHDPAGSTLANKVENTLNKMNRVTSEASGLTQANIVLERWTAAAIVQKFSDMAHSGKGWSKTRFADLGLDEKMAERVMKMFKAEGNFEFEKGFITGRKVARAHFDNWSDTEAREAFLSAAHRLSRQIIQKNDVGNLFMWMSHPVGKAIIQFRTFMVGAYGKQTLKHLNFVSQGEISYPLANLILTMGFAGASYTAQMKIQAMGRSDADEFLEKRLNPVNLGAAAFARAGVSSIVPMLVDTGALYTGLIDPVFSNSRTTGQVTDLLWGNPTASLGRDLQSASRGAFGALRQGDLSQEEWRNIVRILPFGNAIPVVTALNLLIRDNPEWAPRH